MPCALVALGLSARDTLTAWTGRNGNVAFSITIMLAWTFYNLLHKGRAHDPIDSFMQLHRVVFPHTKTVSRHRGLR